MTERIQNFPFILGFVAFLAYLGVQLYNFNTASDGQVEMHRTEMKNTQDELDSLKKKLVEGNKFLQSLELKKQEIQDQVKKLNEYQGALSDAPDVPAIIKLLLTEAKKIDMKVDRIEPGKKNQKEYYLEQEFKLSVRGSYQQILLFAHRISQLQKIFRIEAYTLKKSSSSVTSRATTLNADLSVRAYQYTISKEDRMGTQLDKTNDKRSLPVKGVIKK